MFVQSLDVARPTCPDEWRGDWRLVDWDAHNQIAEWAHFYAENGRQMVTIRKTQHNVQEHLDLNKAERNLQINSRWGDGKRVASIPALVFEGLGLDDALAAGDTTKLHRVLNDSDFKHLRTFEGNL